jgi:CTP:molybdopterin cytidylyltransferase MocA
VFVHALAAALEAGLDGVIVVDGAVDLSGLLPAGVQRVHNAAWADGQAGSLQVAIEAAGAAGHEAVVVGLGDQPRVTAAAWRAVAASASPIAVASYGGRRRNPVRLHRSVWPLLERSGDEGARTVMRARPELVEEIACEGDPFDVDTSADLDRLR